MYHPHPNRNFVDCTVVNRIVIDSTVVDSVCGMVRGTVRVAGCCAVAFLLCGATVDGVRAADTTSVALPSFVDAQRLDSLRHALLTPPQHATAATADAIMPRFHGAAIYGAAATGEGGATAAPAAAPAAIGMASNGDITTAHFQQTLTGARREAGETRELADEVRRRAEELTQRFASGSNGQESSGPVAPPDAPPIAPVAANDAAPPAVTPPVAAKAGSPSGTVAALSPALELAGEAPSAAIGGSAGADRSEDDMAPVAALPFSPAAGAQPARVVPQQPTAGALLPPEPAPEPKPASDKRPKPASATNGEAPAERAPAHAVSAPRKRSLATAGSSASPLRKLAKAAAAGGQPAAAAKPAPDEAPAKIAAKPADAPSAPSSDAQPAPPKSGGGLLSWLKPFTFPKEIGSLGWSAGD